MGKKLRINAFPKDKLIWRIDWLSEISYPDRSRMHRQPSVLVHLSSLRESGLKAVRITCTRHVSIGTLVLLRIGDLWQEREFLSSPQHTSEHWDLDIGPSTTATIKAGQSVEGDFFLPLNEHPGHEAATQSFCIKVELPDGRCLVVPALELIRFYFGSSNVLLEQLFRPPLERSSLYENAAKNGRVAQLDLAPDIPRRSAHDVARIAFDETAWDAANVIGLSCAKQASLSAPSIYPRARFPFYGLTKLRAEGQWLSRGAAQRQTFLVHKLNSCSHRFPYGELHYTVHPATEEAQLKKRSATPDGNDKKTKSSSPALDGLVQQDSATNHAVRTFWLQRKSQFPDLDRKPAFGTLSVAAGEEDDGSKTLSREASLGAVGGQATTGEVGSVALNVGQKSQRPEWVDPVLAALDELNVDFELLTGGEADGWTIAWPPSSSEEAPPSLEDHQLRMCAVELARDGSTSTLVAAASGDLVQLVVVACGRDRLALCLDDAYDVAGEPDEGHDGGEGSAPSMTAWLGRELDSPNLKASAARFQIPP